MLVLSITSYNGIIFPQHNKPSYGGNRAYAYYFMEETAPYGFNGNDACIWITPRAGSRHLRRAGGYSSCTIWRQYAHQSIDFGQHHPNGEEGRESGRA